MKYLIDTNALLQNIQDPESLDLYTIEDVRDEYVFSRTDDSRLKKLGIKILETEVRHLKRLKKVMSIVGKNTDLIRLYTNEGKADVMIIAYILEELENPQNFFDLIDNKWTIVTKDNALLEVANYFKIKTIDAV